MLTWETGLDVQDRTDVVVEKPDTSGLAEAVIAEFGGDTSPSGLSRPDWLAGIVDALLCSIKLAYSNLAAWTTDTSVAYPSTPMADVKELLEPWLAGWSIQKIAEIAPDGSKQYREAKVGPSGEPWDQSPMARGLGLLAPWLAAPKKYIGRYVVPRYATVKVITLAAQRKAARKAKAKAKVATAATPTGGTALPKPSAAAAASIAAALAKLDKADGASKGKGTDTDTSA